MEHSSSQSFTSMINSSLPPSDSQNQSFHGNGGQYPPGAYGAGSSSSPSSPVGCMPFLGAVGAAGSRGDESSPPTASYPMSPAVSYPMSPVCQMNQDPAINYEEGSESSPDEIEKKGKSKSWTKHEDELLIASWLYNSCDSVRGNSKRGDTYWKEVAAELNKYATKEEKKTVMQCKNHWTKTTKKVTKFNAVYNVERTMWPSGANDHDFMEKVRAKYKIVANTKRPFAYEHWWKLVKNEAKWKSSYTAQDMNKRNKLNASGGHSSTSQATDEEGVTKKPMGRNKARALEKSASKSKCSTSSLTSETVDQFNEIQFSEQVKIIL